MGKPTVVAAPPIEPFEDLFTFIDTLPVRDVADLAGKLSGMAAAGSYTCAACGQTYPKGWSDEEAAAERERDFPGLPDDDAVVVCDDCYQSMQERAAAIGHPWAWTDPAWPDPIADAIARVEVRP